jgi:hypothetical protein
VSDIARNIATKLAAAVEEWLVLDVITRVGEVDPSLPVSTPPTGGKSMRTRIRVLQGDIVFETDPAFVSGEYTSLVADHTARVEKAEDILNRTVNTVIDLAKRLDELVK